MTLEALALQGRTQVYDSMASNIGERVFEIRKQSVKDSLSDFKNIEHRLEIIANIHGIEFINDSKATNVNAAWFALESMNRPVIWIAGGMSRASDYSLLFEPVKQKVKAIIFLGQDTGIIARSFEGLVENIFHTTYMDEAVDLAYNMGKKGDIVLLSPACPSFDLFENYEERGELFKNAVRGL
ncbi:MAG: glutamate ligase domain-containing protein [Bacteroidales bacterium]